MFLKGNFALDNAGNLVSLSVSPTMPCSAYRLSVTDGNRSKAL
jgi:hypothetical protein